MITKQIIELGTNSDFTIRLYLQFEIHVYWHYVLDFCSQLIPKLN